VPAATPAITPPGVVTVTTAVLLLLQLPPLVVDVSVDELPTHNPDAPVITGADTTVIVLVAWQPPEV
jgi:hypothetical protein